MTTTAFLPKEVAFAAMLSERAARGVALHQTSSMNHLLTTHLPSIIMENPELVVEMQNCIHVLRYAHVAVEKPTARTECGFHDWINAEGARASRNTLSNSFAVDVEHQIFTLQTVRKTTGGGEQQPAAAAEGSSTAAAVAQPPAATGWEALDVHKQFEVIKALEEGLPLPAAGGGGAAVASGAAGAAGATAAQPQPAPQKPNRRRPRGSARPVLDGTQKGWTSEKRMYRQVHQFSLPTMLGTVGCRSRDTASLAPNARFDLDGYFLVKGSEKTLQTQRKLHINRLYVYRPADTRWSWQAEIRSCHAAKIRSTSTLTVLIRCGPGGSGTLRGIVRMPYISVGIPLLAVGVALGFRSAEELATSAATGGALSGREGALPPSSWWDTPEARATRLWVLSLLRDEGATREVPPFEEWGRVRTMQWIGEEDAKKRAAGGQGAAPGGGGAAGGGGGLLGEKDRARGVAHLLANEFLPQLGLDSSVGTIARKGQYFAMILRWLADVARGLVAPDDRDHAGNRQYDTAGMLCATLARQHYRIFRKRVVSEIRRFADTARFVGIPELFNIKRMQDSYVYGMSTGNWGLQKGSSTHTGVSQMLNRLNPLATMSHLCRTDAGLRREGRQEKPRQIDLTSRGHECVAETPEGQSCGLVLQLAQGVWVCQGQPADRLIRQAVAVLKGAVIPLLDPVLLTGAVAKLPPPVSIFSPAAAQLKPMVVEHPPEEWARLREVQAASDAAVGALGDSLFRLVINGVMVGFVKDGEAAAQALRAARRARRLPFDVAVEVNAARGLLCLTGEAGGLRRPLFVLDHGPGAGGPLRAVEALYRVHATAPPERFWEALVVRGCVEYLSKHEEENMLVADACCTPVRLHDRLTAHTHAEIHPSFMLGLAAATIPFSPHNQAPRTAYYANMCKQAAGTPPPDMHYTNGLRLWYPQRPMVSTWAAHIHGIWAAPMGTNAWILVASDGGRNQEDSLYFNQDSANRGMFAVTVTHTYMEDCQGGGGADAQHFERPPAEVWGKRTANYSLLNERGLVPPGVRVRGGDVVIGKTMDANEMGCPKRSTLPRDQSVVLPSREGTQRVDAVTMCRGRDDKDFVSMRTHSVRLLQAGDKLTSAHGQKGVLGCLRPARDMPYSAETGIIADAVMNPHALPSRMTLGMSMEMGLGLACAAEGGEQADGTPFNGVTTADVEAALLAAGFDNMGHQVMYRGESGERVEGTLFYGCAHYNRLKQMVDDKHHARARGPVHVLTEQPLEGRAKDGGFRVGDMERDAIVSHGAAGVAEDRLLHQSDYARVPVCVKCGTVAMGRAPPDQRSMVVGRNELSGYCLACQAAGNVHEVPMPFAVKLLAAEMGAANLRVEFKVDVESGLDPSTTAAVGLPRQDPEEERELLRPAVEASFSSKRDREEDHQEDQRPRPWKRVAMEAWIHDDTPDAVVGEGGNRSAPAGFYPIGEAGGGGGGSSSTADADPWLEHQEPVAPTCHVVVPPGFSMPY